MPETTLSNTKNVKYSFSNGMKRRYSTSTLQMLVEENKQTKKNDCVFESNIFRPIIRIITV